MATTKLRTLGKHPTAVVYLIHFDGKLHHAQHYVGMTENLVDRMRTHIIGKTRNGRGSRLVHTFVKLGHAPTVVRTWPTTSRRQALHVEWVIKHKTRNARSLCPECTPGAERARATIPGYLPAPGAATA